MALLRVALDSPLRKAHEKTFHFVPFYFICIFATSSLPDQSLRGGGSPVGREGTTLSSLREEGRPLGHAQLTREAEASAAQRGHRPGGCQAEAPRMPCGLDPVGHQENEEQRGIQGSDEGGRRGRARG